MVCTSNMGTMTYDICDLVVRASPSEREDVSSIHGRDRPKSLKQVAVAFPLGAEDYGNSTKTGPPVSG